MLDLDNLYNEFINGNLDSSDLILSIDQIQYIENFLNKNKIIQIPSLFKSITLSDDELTINGLCRALLILITKLNFAQSMLKKDVGLGKQLSDDELKFINTEINFPQALSLNSEMLDLIQTNKYLNIDKTCILGELTEEDENRIINFLKITPYYFNKIPFESLSTFSLYDIVSMIYYNIDEKRHTKPEMLTNDKSLKYKGFTHCGIEGSDYTKQYITAKTINPPSNISLHKLAFLRNLLEYHRSGILVNSNEEIGRMYHENNTEEEQETYDLFDKIYSEEWNEAEFRKNQSSFIGKPKNNLNRDNNLNIVRNTKSKIDSDNIYYGFLFKGDNTNQLSYLHIRKRESNDNDYEIEFYILPNNIFNERLQITRHDSFPFEVKHNNLNKNQLRTYTHVHVYNPFEMILGRKKGEYDISYNSETTPKPFQQALKECLEYNFSHITNSNDLISQIQNIVINSEPCLESE